MECNKDEALRAKEIAEKKMQNNDFEGARKIALKAQNLYPELENITHLLSICDVHCSSQTRLVGSEKDWYGILQVERLADESTVKKQYRRLALILHPDKNRFPGAEAAFKLICEANAVLSDTQKKAVYDNKLRLSVRSASVNLQPHHINKSAQFNKQYGVRINASNGFTGLNQHQATRPSYAARQDKQGMFWTCCPFCRMKYQYLRQVVNTSLHCQACAKSFVAYEITTQGVPLASKRDQPADPSVPKPVTSQPTVDLRDKKVPQQAELKKVSQNDKLFAEAHAGSVGTAKTQGIPPQRDTGVSEGISMANAAKESASYKARETGVHDAHSFPPGKQGGIPNGDKINRESGDLKNKNRKRSRKVVLESSESFGSSSESDGEGINMEQNIGHPTGNLNSEPGYVRRSSRKRHQVSYNESDDDIDGPPKIPQVNDSREDGGNYQKVTLDAEEVKHASQKSFPPDSHYSKSESKDIGTVHPGENLQPKHVQSDKEVNFRGKTGAVPGFDAPMVEIYSDSDQESKDDPDEDKCECADPEFSDFEKERDESRFEVNQIWACYDDLDGMPRFYAKIKKVSFPFKVSFTWLEAVPVNEACEEWIYGSLPVGCGIFKLGKTETSSRRLSFSHLMRCEKGKKRGSLVIYPRVGEVWALFKDWDLKWSSEPENHASNFKYELVEVLSDFVPDIGIKVGYLIKIGGFVSLFQRSSKSEPDSFLIDPSELYKFSHCVPFSRMTGSEKQGVPVGSLELDPASLPLNANDLCCPVKADMRTSRSEHGEVGDSYPPKSAKRNNKSATSNSTNTPKKIVDLDGIDAEQFKTRRSPRGQNMN